MRIEPHGDRWSEEGGQEGQVALMLTQLLRNDCGPTLLRAVSSVVQVSNEASHVWVCRLGGNGWEPHPKCSSYLVPAAASLTHIRSQSVVQMSVHTCFSEPFFRGFLLGGVWGVAAGRGAAEGAASEWREGAGGPSVQNEASERGRRQKGPPFRTSLMDREYENIQSTLLTLDLKP